MNTNIIKVFFAIAVAGLVAVGLPMSSSATMTQYGLYDTGVDSNGNSLQGEATDSHWKLNGGAAMVVVPPVAGWLDDSSPNGPSRWLSADGSGGNDGNGTFSYSFTTTFTLSGLVNVSLSGEWASDNASILILNGHTIGTIPFGSYPNWSFQQYTTFADTLQSDFILNGMNTLTILDQNGDLTAPDGQPGGPFGVRANDLTITGTPVPEPTSVAAGSLLLMPLGISAVRVLRKSRVV